MGSVSTVIFCFCSLCCTLCLNHKTTGQLHLWGTFVTRSETLRETPAAAPCSLVEQSSRQAGQHVLGLSPGWSQSSANVTDELRNGGEKIKGNNSVPKPSANFGPGLRQHESRRAAMVTKQVLLCRYKPCSEASTSLTSSKLGKHSSVGKA